MNLFLKIGIVRVFEKEFLYGPNIAFNYKWLNQGLNEREQLLFDEYKQKANLEIAKRRQDLQKGGDRSTDEILRSLERGQQVAQKNVLADIDLMALNLPSPPPLKTAIMSSTMPVARQLEGAEETETKSTDNTELFKNFGILTKGYNALKPKGGKSKQPDTELFKNFGILTKGYNALKPKGGKTKPAVTEGQARAKIIKLKVQKAKLKGQGKINPELAKMFPSLALQSGATISEEDLNDINQEIDKQIAYFEQYIGKRKPLGKKLDRSNKADRAIMLKILKLSDNNPDKAAALAKELGYDF
jgi:hypothetical protein